MTLLSEILKCTDRSMDVVFCVPPSMPDTIEVRVSNYHAKIKSTHCNRVIPRYTDEAGIARTVEYLRNQVVAFDQSSKR